MENLLTPKLIQRGGSKLETTRLIIEREIPIPRPLSTWLYSGQSLDSIMTNLQEMLRNGGKIIVRGSHPTDYHWSIDAIHTERNVTTIGGVEAAIAKIEEGVNSNDFKLHCQDGGVPWSGEVHALIQQQLESPIVGSMLRHPHLGDIHIEYFDINKRSFGDNRDPVEFADVNTTGEISFGAIFRFIDVQKLIDEVYIPFEESGICDPSYAQQVEFGQPQSFLQARPAFLKQPVQEFPVPSADLRVREADWDNNPLGLGFPYIHAYNAFGITASEGIELDFVVIKQGDIGSKILPQEEYGILLTDALKRTPSIKYGLGSLKVFVSFLLKDQSRYLNHCAYRFMKKSGFSIVEAQLENCDRDRDIIHDDDRFNAFLNSEFTKCRFWSNGRHGLIVPVKYL